MQIKKIAMITIALTIMAPAFAFNPMDYVKNKVAQNSDKAEPNSDKARAKTVGNGGQTANCEQHFPLGIPMVVSAEREKVEKRSFYLCRDAYAVQFDPLYKTPIWSAENLTGVRMAGAIEPRAEDFMADPDVPARAQAALSDYKGYKVDRGHTSPAADMRIYNAMLKAEELQLANMKAMSQSFFLTNMVPQVGVNNNRGIWKDLEGQVRGWAMEKGQVLVVTGPIYDQGFKTIGRSSVGVPTRLYKVVIDTKTYDAIAFIIPNRQIITKRTKKLDEGNENLPQTTPSQAISCTPNPCSIRDFAVPVAHVEKAAGLKFFTRIAPNDREKVVNQVNPSNWRMR